MDSFSGFDAAAVSILKQLPDFDASSYAAQKTLLTEGLRRPGAALIAAVAESLPLPLRVDPRASVSPLHNDLRFAPAGAPKYKDHLLLTTWQGSDKKNSPTLWLRIDASGVGFASGVMFTPSLRERWRNAVSGPAGERLQRALDRLAKRKENNHFDIAGAPLKRVPQPWTEDHPRADLLKMTGFQVRFAEVAPPELLNARLVSWVRKRMMLLLPIHEWIVGELFQGELS